MKTKTQISNVESTKVPFIHSRKLTSILILILLLVDRATFFLYLIYAIYAPIPTFLGRLPLPLFAVRARRLPGESSRLLLVAGFAVGKGR